MVRRFCAALLVAAAAGAAALVPVGPAAAVAPVADFPWLPSALVAGTTVAPPETETEAERTARLQREANYRGTLIEEADTRGWTSQNAPQPISGGKPPARGPGGGLLSTVLLAPVLVQGGLQMAAVSSEGQALGLADSASGIVCQSIGSTTGFSAWLYGEVNCGATITSPNSDRPAGGTLTGLTGGGATLVYLGIKGYFGTSGAQYYCYSLSGTLSSGYSYRWPAAGGGWSTGSTDNVPGCVGAFGQAAKWVSRGLDGTASPAAALFGPSSNTVPVGQMSEVAANPDRRILCTVFGTTTSVTLPSETTYKETEGLPISDIGRTCDRTYKDFVSSPGRGPGLLPDRISIGSQDDTGAITEIADMPVPSEAEQSKPSEGLKLYRLVGTTLRSCMTWEVDCANWWEESDEGASTDTYRCTYGGADVALAECGVYRNTFREPEDVRVMDPEADNEYSWGTGPDPYTTPGGSTVTGGGACSPNWSWNPVDWVLNPLKCAFIPGSAAVDAAKAAIGEGIDNSVVGSVGQSLAVLGSAFDAGVGCGGLPFHLEAFGHTLVDAMLLESCSEPAAGIAATVRIILSVAIIGGGIMAFTRYLGSLFGFESFGRNRTEAKGGPSFD